MLSLLDESTAASRVQWISELVKTRPAFRVSSVDDWYTIVSPSGKEYLIPHGAIGKLSQEILARAAERSVLLAAGKQASEPARAKNKKAGRRRCA